ncbi:enoyl-CoA hydratase [Acidocella aquatica]|uniref:Enoyl-CoA hydratase n=1 Tax=Acidocella aquatica TaxID=1922313 RepID=A0ABQ6AEJ8_9PROT|nr:enoyl-CoA hydratase/isomerase family protein [Acidocella aquatica]GLR69052.1 enoyl-CoA hydratase [Acidocella aquatica]
MNEAPHMLIEEDGAILIASLNRPEKLNALSSETLATFDAALHRFRDTRALKVMLIRASGRYFSAGADLRENAPGAPPATGSGIREMHRLTLHGMHRIYDEMEHIEKPIVVAHQGTCVGGGLEMSLSCDFRLAAESARYSFPEGKFGVLPASNGVSRLTRIVGTHWARYLIMGNFIADANKALIMGLVHEVWPDEGFQERALAFCRHLAGNSGEQMGTAKIAIEMAYDLGPEMGRHVERMANSALMLAPDYLSGMKQHVGSIGKKD